MDEASDGVDVLLHVGDDESVRATVNLYAAAAREAARDDGEYPLVAAGAGGVAAGAAAECGRRLPAREVCGRASRACERARGARVVETYELCDERRVLELRVAQLSARGLLLGANLRLVLEDVERCDAQNVPVDLDAEAVRLQYRVEREVPRHVGDVDGDGDARHRRVNDEVHTVLLCDVVEYVAYVGVDDVEVDRLADKAGLAVLRALRSLRRLVRAGGRRRRARLRAAFSRRRARVRRFGREFDDESAAFEPRALAHGRAQRDLKSGDGVVAAQRELDGDCFDERRRDAVRR